MGLGDGLAWSQRQIACSLQCCTVFRRYANGVSVRKLCVEVDSIIHTCDANFIPSLPASQGAYRLFMGLGDGLCRFES